MADLKSIQRGLKGLSVYRNLLETPVLRSLSGLLGCAYERELREHWGEFAHNLYESGEGGLTALVGGGVLYDSNAFTRACGAGKEVANPLLQAAKADLDVLEAAACLSQEDLAQGLGLEDASGFPGWETGGPPSPLGQGWAERIQALMEFHKSNGFGDFARYNAFSFREGKLFPVAQTNRIRLMDLKNYEIQRGMVVDNTQSFLMGLPANNVLLYGDRGTGKSSTVHALLNEYAKEGLRMVEITKQEIGDFSTLADAISQTGCRFIIFIDDLSFSDGDDSYAGLKAVLEGGLAARPENALIYATSNRRHLVREKFSDRQGDEIHRGDSMQELLSLSDRFGLSVTFANPTRLEYGDILLKIAADRGLMTLMADEDLLLKRGERFALERGGRSPRVARQFVDMVEARLKRGREI